MGFQTEVKQLLQLMINSLYSNKEIFLRELISNASDACDKLRFEALSDDALYENDSELKIQIECDKEARTITIRDNGIGMNRQEVIDNIGTIAKSGTKQFLDALTGDQAKDSHLIGQFGVGFYASFIVAKKVTLNTRRAGLTEEHGVRWTSTGEGEFDLETIDKPSRGTEIILELKEDQDEFLEEFRLRNIVKTYSDHISMPIQMPSQDEEKKGEMETINQVTALWKRSKSEIKDEEYNEFYKHISHDFEDPIAHVHTHVEGNQSYTSLFYIPKRAPFDMWDRERRHGIKLYVKRVFIMDDAEHLMPDYLRFVRGLVDSDDLPLNVSREILQHNRLIDKMRAASVKKVLGLLESMAKNNTEDYATVWKAFGAVLKEGVAEDVSNKEKIAGLFRFATTLSDEEAQTVSLAEYIERMQEGQDKIYYISAETFAAAKHSPHLEVFRKKGIEVLLMSERVDEWMMSHLTEFAGKSFHSVAKGDLDLGELEDKDEKEAREKAAEEAKDVVSKLQDILKDKVKEVRITHRLTNSPSCLVVEEEEMAANLQRMLKSAGHAVPTTLPILEINPGHALIVGLNAETDAEKLENWANLLFEQALLAEGGQLDDPAAFVNRMNDLLVASGE
ncbi:MAG TPA: molecular chaperone HtpG [Gammaproteobacteria bacterium]|nr:molecular chaperone HtpG [Gammaproteobacteria bacterium]